MTEVIEGDVIDVTPTETRALTVVQQPGQSLVAAPASDPADMVAVASRLATVLKDIVERQKLYAVIQGKKFPQVEAWQTIGRLDNVVAREVPGGVHRLDDGSYEAEVDLIRLSDAMVIGHGSAICGDKDDRPWNTRPEYARRSMAVTRATSRAFRAHYSWIMALAGYEPTPAEEMPSDSPAPTSSGRTPAPAAGPPPGSGGIPWSGPVSVGQSPVDATLRETADGAAFGFVVTDQNGKRVQALAMGDMAHALYIATAEGKALPDSASIDGELVMVPWEKKQPDGTMKAMPPYRRVILSHVDAGEWVLPAAGGLPPAPTDDGKAADLDALAW